MQVNEGEVNKVLFCFFFLFSPAAQLPAFSEPRLSKWVGAACPPKNVTATQFSESCQGLEFTREFALRRLDGPGEFWRGVGRATLLCVRVYFAVISPEPFFQRPRINSSTNKILGETQWRSTKAFGPGSERGDVLKTWAHWWNCNYRRALKIGYCQPRGQWSPVAKRLASDTDVKHMFPPAAQQK